MLMFRANETAQRALCDYALDYAAVCQYYDSILCTGHITRISGPSLSAFAKPQ